MRRIRSTARTTRSGYRPRTAVRSAPSWDRPSPENHFVRGSGAPNALVRAGLRALRKIARGAFGALATTSDRNVPSTDGGPLAWMSHRTAGLLLGLDWRPRVAAVY